MTVTVVEAQKSRGIAKQGGGNVGYRTFSVYDASLTSTDLVFFQFGQNGLPTYGEMFPGANLIAVDVDVQRTEGFNDQYDVTWKYVDAGDDGETGQVLTPGFVEINSEIGGEFEPMWRALSQTQFGNLVATGGTYANGISQNNPAVDIGGLHIDFAGEPISWKRRTSKLMLGVTMSVRPKSGQWDAFTFRRNNTPFNLWPTGSVVYVGAQIARIAPSTWRATHTFVRDQYFHMHQSPFRLPDAKVALGGDNKAEQVVFVQPFPDFANFYAIDSNFVGIA